MESSVRRTLILATKSRLYFGKLMSSWAADPFTLVWNGVVGVGAAAGGGMGGAEGVGRGGASCGLETGGGGASWGLEMGSGGLGSRC